MGKNDICAISGCANSRRKPDRLVVKEHVGILRWHSPKTQEDINMWKSQLNRQISMSTKVCSNHFTSGYCSDVCRTPTLYLNGYDKDEYKMLYGVRFPKDAKITTKGSIGFDEFSVVTPCLHDHDYIAYTESFVTEHATESLSQREVEVMEFLNQQLLVRNLAEA